MDRDALLTPCLLVRLDRVRANLRVLLQKAGGDRARLRPHLKTTKIPEVWALFLDAGLRAFKAATTREAAVFLGLARERGEAADLLVALAHRGPALRRLAELAAAYPDQRLAVLSEDPGHAGTARAAELGVFVDLDPGWGRSGIPFDQEERLRATVRAAGPAFRGLHAYEGHLRDPEPEARARKAAALYERLLAIAGALGDPPLVTSGTPAFEAALTWPGFAGREHQVSPGTVLFHDLTTEAFGVRGFRFAATVLTTVVSAPAPAFRTADAGSKALDAASGHPCCAVAGRPGLEPGVPSEEHLPLRVLEGPAPEPGTRLELVPRHVCPTVNLHDEAVLMEGEEIRRIVPVAARGHEIRARP